MGVVLFWDDNITTGSLTYTDRLNWENLNISLTNSAAIGLVDIIRVANKLGLENQVFLWLLLKHAIMHLIEDITDLGRNRSSFRYCDRGTVCRTFASLKDQTIHRHSWYGTAPPCTVRPTRDRLGHCWRKLVRSLRSPRRNACHTRKCSRHLVLSLLKEWTIRFSSIWAFSEDLN